MTRVCVPWFTIVSLAVAVVSAPAQPVVRVLEDFEGPLAGWPQDARLTDDASEGRQALRWAPSAAGGPQAIAFNIASRAVEMSDWDRLLFDYKVDSPDCGWWGVKVIDFPLGDGMQATWQVNRDTPLTVGQWATASVDLHSPMWLWGERPDETSQVIYFRAQGPQNKPYVILLDNIRMESDPVRLQSVQSAPAAAGESEAACVHRLTVANRTAAPVALSLRPGEVSAGLRVHLPPEPWIVPAADTATLEIGLSAAVAGPGALPPLSRLSTELTIRPQGMENMDQSTTLSLNTPLGALPHPSLLITAEQAEAIMGRVAANETAKAIYDGLKAGADAWLEQTPEFPDRGSQWWHWYTCKACGGRLNTKSDTEHVCADCGAVYAGWPYDDVVLDRKHSALARAIRDLGLMYVLTGEEPYARKAREILLGYAERYLQYPLHNIHDKPERGGAHVGPQTLDEAVWLIPVVQGFDCIHDTLSEQDIDFIAERMLLPAAELCRDHQWGIHNICCWHGSAYGLVGLVLGDAQLAGEAINGPKGFREQIAKGVTDDGFWYESAWGYHFYTMMALQPLAIAAGNVGIDLYSERYKGMYDAPLRFMAPGGELPAFNDSGTANVLGQGSMYQVAYARWGDPRYLLPIRRSGQKSIEALLFGAEPGQIEDFTLGSTLFPAAGYVILRSGPPGSGDADRHVPQNYVALDYGPHGGGHGHPDKLGFVFYGRGKLLAEDPGCIAYGNPAHSGWFRQTVSHSTVVVDGKSQHECTGELQFSAFAEGFGLAGATAGSAYPGVSLRRTMALAGDRLIDVFLCQSEEERTFDWVYHNRGALELGVPVTPLTQAPEGQGYEWAKEWRQGEAPETWEATWKLEDGPGVAFAQAREGTGSILTAIGMGNPTRIKVPLVISRVQGTRALYCSAIHVHEGDEVPELEVRPLAVEGEAGQAAGVEVRGDGIVDVLLVNPSGGAMRAGDYELDGHAALLRYRGNKLEKLLVAGEGTVRVNGRPMVVEP